MRIDWTAWWLGKWVLPRHAQTFFMFVESSSTTLSSQRSVPFPHLVFVGPMKVEGQVMGSSSENILKQSFGGVYSNELLAEGGSLYSERPEPFSYISVEVGVL